MGGQFVPVGHAPVVHQQLVDAGEFVGDAAERLACHAAHIVGGGEEPAGLAVHPQPRRCRPVPGTDLGRGGLGSAPPVGAATVGSAARECEIAPPDQAAAPGIDDRDIERHPAPRTRDRDIVGGQIGEQEVGEAVHHREVLVRFVGDEMTEQVATDVFAHPTSSPEC
ncbi:Uncharacterised protein [Rhodococcus rhodochrous]|nr:Uncharacterised protein [Rhodococcus rhodochrous]